MASYEGFRFGDLELNDGITYTFETLEFNPAKKVPQWTESADADGQVLVAEPRYENAILKARVQVEPQASQDLAQSAIAAIVQRCQQAEHIEGGLRSVWTPSESSTAYDVYVLSGELVERPISHEAGYFANAPVAEVELTLRPFLYGPEVSGPPVTSSLPAFEVPIPSVAGHVPAEGRLVVTDAASRDRDHVEWGIQALEAGAPATNLLLDSDSLSTSGFAGSGTTRSGAYDPNASGNNVIRATLTTTPVVVCGTDTATVASRAWVGTFRVKARVFASGTGPYYVRAAWRSGDSPFIRANSYAQPLDDVWSEVDLGTVTFTKPPSGTQSSEIRIEAYSATAGDTLDVDYITLVPALAYGKARAPVTISAPSVFAARDEFDQSAGALSGKTAPVGGAWSGAGDSDDFSVDATNRNLIRTTTGADADENSGRYGLLAFSHTGAVVAADVGGTLGAITVLPLERQAVLMRYSNTSNWLMAEYLRASIFRLRKRVAGTVTTIWQGDQNALFGKDYRRLLLACDARGNWFLYGGPAGTAIPPTLLASGKDTDLAQGGALASGTHVGVYKYYNGTGAGGLTIDNFAAWSPTLDHAIYSGRSAEFRAAGDDPALRYNAAGTILGRTPSYRGSRFYVPESGQEARTGRVLVKARRNDVDTLPDDQITDSTTAQVHLTPRYLTPA